jgi:hypothetical protein
MAINEDTQTILDIYAFMKAALELCEVEVIERQNARGNAEVLAIVRAMGGDWRVFWTEFRKTWGIPDHPLAQDILEMSAEAARRE